MDTRLPLTTLLSQMLVAFTIEFDNEFEHQMPHRTTWGPAAHSRSPLWLVSQAMWTNFMQFVGEDGVLLRELEGMARITNLAGLERWGYIVVEPDRADARPRPPRADWVVRPTRAGRRAQEVWQPLASAIEGRWQDRFGEAAIDDVRLSLEGVLSQLDVDLPPYLPVLRYANGMFAEDPLHEGWASARRDGGQAPGLDLSVFLCRVLLALTVEFERDSDVSLAIGANTLRVLDRGGVRLRDIPLLTGTSKEAISASVGSLERHGYVVVEPDPTAGRATLVRLTERGLTAQDAFRQLLGDIEERWQARFGGAAIGHLRESLERLVGEPGAASSPLFQGLEPYPDGWRASIPRPDTLPHYPMVLHRGGFPDGS